MKSKEVIEMLKSHDVLMNVERLNEGFIQVYESCTNEIYAFCFNDSDDLFEIDDGRTMIIHCDKIELFNLRVIRLFYKDCEIGKIIASSSSDDEIPDWFEEEL